MTSGLRGRLRLARIALVVVPVVLVLYPVQLALVLLRAPFGDILPMVFWRLCLWAMGTRVTLRGRPERGRPLLLCANHVSWFDIIALGSLFPMSFVARADMAQWPVIGHFARLQHTIFIDRTRRMATAAANREIADRLAAGDAIVLFAEGTTSDGNRVLPFRSSLLGAVRDAVRDQGGRTMTVQPVAILYRALNGVPFDRRTRPLFAWYGDIDLLPHLGPALSAGVVDVDVVFGAPVRLAEGFDRKSVTQSLENAVRAMVYQGLTGRAAAHSDQAARSILFAPDSR
jgi:1-acyl-sn-glycerol-3-phosphate acyltransferase